MPLSGSSHVPPPPEVAGRRPTTPPTTKPARNAPRSGAVATMFVSTLLLILSTAIGASSSAATADAGIPTMMYHFDAMSRGIEPLDKTTFVQSYAKYYRLRQQMRAHASAVTTIDDVSGPFRHLEESEAQVEFTQECVDALMAPPITDDRLISQVEFTEFLNGLADDGAKDLKFHNLFWTTQVKFAWGICTNRDQTHDSSEVDECLNDLEASGNDRSDGEFGFKLKRNGKNEDEIRTQVTDMCSDVYADVVQQGIVKKDDITDDAEGANDNDDAPPTSNPSPVSSPTSDMQPTADADSPTTASPIMPPTTISADDLDIVLDDDTTATETTEYFDVFFTYRMDFSDASITAETLASDYNAEIASTIAIILRDQGVSRRLALSLSTASTPIENINYIDAVCPEDGVAKSCVFIVSLVRVEAEADTEDQDSADSAVQTPLRVSMAPISNTFEETVGLDGLVQVEWISGGPGQDAIANLGGGPGQDAVVNLGTDGTGGNKSISDGGIAALSVCLTVLLAGGLFALSRRRENGDDVSTEQDIDDVEAQELRSASVSKDLSPSKSIARGFFSKDGDASIDRNVEIESVAASAQLSVPQSSGEVTAEGSRDWAACGATAAILASKSSFGDEISSIAPSSRVPTPTQEEDRAGSVFAELLFDLPPDSLSTSHPSSEGLTSLVAPENVPQLSPQGEALNCTRTSDSVPGVVSNLNSTADSSPDKNVPTIGYTGIAMVGAAAAPWAATSMATSSRNGEDRSFDGSFISEKPSEANRSLTSKSALFSLEQKDALKRIDAAINTGDWAAVLTEANTIAANDDNRSLMSEMSSLRSTCVASSTVDRTNLSQEDAKKAAHIDSLIAHGDWNKVSEAASRYQDDASQKTARSAQSFLGRLFGVGANNETAAGAGTAAPAASFSTDKDTETPRKSTEEYDIQDGIALAPTHSSEESPAASSPPDDSSPDSESSNSATNPDLVHQEEGADAAAVNLSSLLDPNASTSDNNSQISADRPLLASAKDKKRKKSPKNLFNLAGSKKSSSSRSPSFDYNGDVTPKAGQNVLVLSPTPPKASWKRKLGIGGKSKSASEAMDHLELLEDSSVESRSLGSDAMNAQDEMRSSLPPDISSNVSGMVTGSQPGELDEGTLVRITSNGKYKDKVGIVSRMTEKMVYVTIEGIDKDPRISKANVEIVVAGTFAAAALPPPRNVITGDTLNDVSSDIYASSASASIPTDADFEDAMSHTSRSFIDEIDMAIENGDWAAVEEAAANMLNGASSSDASSHVDGSISSAASSDFHSTGSHLSSSRGGSSIGGSTVNTDKIKALEQAIENNNWQRVLELSGKYKKEASEDDGESPKGAAAAAAWAIDRSFNEQIGEDKEEQVDGGDEVI